MKFPGALPQERGGGTPSKQCDWRPSTDLAAARGGTGAVGKKTRQMLSKNNGLTLIVALSYGGRTEIVEAVQTLPRRSNGVRWSLRRSPSGGGRIIYTPGIGRIRIY